MPLSMTEKSAITREMRRRYRRASKTQKAAMLDEQHDEWQVGRRYMPVESIEKAMQPVLTVEDGLDQEVVPALMAG